MGNQKYLVIVESPSKCKTITNILGSDYKCIATKGHLVELVTPKNVQLQNIQLQNLQFKIIKRQQKHCQSIKKEIKNAHCVILATDMDREGECIAWHICRLFDLPINKTPRARFQEITTSSIQNAFHQLDKINMNMVYSALARQWMDYAIGYSVSPLIWKYIGSFRLNGLSAGRCQTPALSLICERDDTINDKLHSPVIQLSSNFSLNNKIKLSSIFTDTFADAEDCKLFLEKCINFDFSLEAFQEHNICTPSPAPFITSTLQQNAASNLHWSPSFTMKIAQSLYEGGYITYIRTDHPVISKDFVKYIKEYVEINYTKEYFKNPHNAKQFYQSNKHTQEAHECIRPTQLARDIKKLNANETKLYMFIFKQTIASCMVDSKSLQLQYKITSPREGAYFKGTLNKSTSMGWKIVSFQNLHPEVDVDVDVDVELENRKDISNEGCNSKNKDKLYDEVLQHFKLRNNLFLKINNIDSSLKEQNRISPFSYSQWIKSLDQLGIGRPSTFTTITEKVLSREYAKCRDRIGDICTRNVYHMRDQSIMLDTQTISIGQCKNKILSTPLGKIINTFIQENASDLFSYDFTKNMESGLDDIANGKQKWTEVCNSLGEKIDNVKKTIDIKPFKMHIHKEFILFFSRNGIAIQKRVPGTTKKMKWEKYNLVPDKIDYIEDNFTKWQKENEWTEFITCFEKHMDTVCLGEYEDEKLNIKKGRYGYYISQGKHKYTVPKEIDLPITLETAIGIIETTRSKKDEKTIMTIAKKYPILNGPYGPYLEIKHPKLNKKNSCLSLKSFKGDLIKCNENEIMQWLYKRHKRRIIKDNIGFVFEAFT
jgi:DNA topoisomerase-1